MPSSKKKAPVRSKTLITGHANADFDCLSAICAAAKLYPEPLCVFPGSQEKSLRRFYEQTAKPLFPFVEAKDVEPEHVKTLVLVDTRQRHRLEHVASTLELAGRGVVTVHAFDHHPDTENDVPASGGDVLPLGSTTTILSLRLRDAGIALNPEEALVLAVGLYEDTGTFSFTSITPEDFEAGAYLVSQGLDPAQVANLLAKELTPVQISLLNDLFESEEKIEVGEVEVTLAQASSSEYMSDLALLAHKFVDISHVPALIILVRLADHVQVIARSSVQAIDVGRICEALGGGGHTFAASATIKDRTPQQVREEVLGHLASLGGCGRSVESVMSHPPYSIGLTATFADAVAAFARHGFKVLPVTDERGVCRGLVEHRIADKAVSHGYGQLPVAEYMQRTFRSVSRESCLDPVVTAVVGERQHLVPVTDTGEPTGRLLGVITRTDVVNLLIEEPARIPESLHSGRRKGRSAKQLLKERIPSHLLELLERAGRLAQERGEALYAVGGFVRDLLLRRDNLDIDLVVEGDGIEFARALAGELHGRVRAHAKFRTAVLLYPGPENGNGRATEDAAAPRKSTEPQEERIDVATARLEYYEHPAALPTVELSSIKMDLYRRDFTINALALELNPGRFGQVVDFFGGQRDLKDGVVRVLHSFSFVEDPTRILRAVRFEQRFGFAIGPQTERLIRNAVELKILDRLSGTRIFHELELICGEPTAPQSLRRLGGFGVLEAVHPCLTLTRRKESVLKEVATVLSWHELLYAGESPRPWMCYLLALTAKAARQDLEGVAVRLNLLPRQREDFLALRPAISQTRYELYGWRERGRRMSELYFILEHIALEGLIYLMAASRNDETRRSVSIYLTRLRDVELAISGEDLAALGLAPGPAYGEVLRKVLAHKLDGKTRSREDELELAKTIIGRMVG